MRVPVRAMRARRVRGVCHNQNESTGADGQSSENAANDALQKLVADFPELYEAWFNGQLKRLVTESVLRAQNEGGITAMEISFPAVPNIDEIDFGTATNQRFAEMLAADELKTGYRKVRKYLLAYANIFWALEVVKASLKPSESAVILSTDGVDKSDLTTVPPNVQVLSLTAAAKMGPKLQQDLIVMVDPRSTETWKQVQKLSKPGARMIFMNSSFNEVRRFSSRVPDFDFDALNCACEFGGLRRGV